jgi:hypothetical protein
MTRCLNCGAERTGDQCEACGLTSAAAGVILRRNVLYRTGFFLVSTLAALLAGHLYPPLELDGILIFVGVLFFVTLALAVQVERAALRLAEAEALKRIFYALIPVPLLLAGILYVNGRFDASSASESEAAVVGKFSMPALLPSRRLVVTSWRPGRSWERVPVGRIDFDRFRSGDLVVVRVQKGLLGIPWVEGVYRR